MKHAKIKAGRVVKVVDDGGRDINTLFHPEIVATLVPDPNGEAVEGGTWDGVAFGPVPSLPCSPADVAREAERRIEAGTLINGIVFRCDTASVARINGLKDLPNEVFPVTFKTAAGATVVVADAGEAVAIADAAGAYVAQILSKSSALQDQVALLTEAERLAFDITDDLHWA